jgi:HK97 family phage prohead protease
VGYLRDLLFGRPDPVIAGAFDPAPAFMVDEDSIDPAVFGLTSYAAPTAPAARVARAAAMQVPAVKRARDLIAGSIGGLPIDLFAPTRERVVSNLFTQPEAACPRSVTMTRTVEDLLFEGIAWWRIEAFGWHGYPVKVKRVHPSLVTEANGKRWIDGRHVPDAELIRFDSPNDPLLVAGARAIRTCLALDTAAAEHAIGAPPIDYFTPAEGVDPATDDEIVAMLDGWKAARQARSTGYVPAALKYNIGGWTPEQLQMAEARQHAVLEIARVAGVDPEELGVSTTSRTYANQQDRRKAFLDFTLGGYVNAIEDRLAMGDVTPRGYYVRFNFSTFLRSDDKTRYEAYRLGLDVGAILPEEIRALEDRTPTTQEIPVQNAPAPAAALNPAATFDTAPDLTVGFEADATAATFAIDPERRTISGQILPFGVTAPSKGQLWQFARGTVKWTDPTRIKLWIDHDMRQAVGFAQSLEEREDGIWGTFKVARGAEGDRALTLAEDRVLDGFSIGLRQGGRYRRDTATGVNHAIEAPLMETSLTPAPSFDGARVHQVAASAAHTERGPEVADSDSTTQADAGTEAPEAPDFAALVGEIKTGFTELGARLAMPQRETVPATGSGPAFVAEPSPYRFDGTEGEHSFSEDLRSYGHDAEARQRLETFMEEAFTQFAVTGANVAALNPTQNRPDLFVPNLTFTRPLWDLVSTGVVTDKTPFTIPKFASASGLVGAHTEGVEPTPGAFTATSQTVSPAPVSGKVEIVREVWDQGGNPKADAMIWGEMLNGYFEAIEAKIATMLAAVATAEINLGSAVDSALVTAVQNILVDLQFVRGGNRYSALALDGLLFKALINAGDTTGRKHLPVVNPENAQGSTDSNFGGVQIGTLTGRAAWALGATNASKSYLFVPSSVWAWASAPKRFTFEYRVSAIDLAIWGYTGSAVLRDSDVKPIDYTTADA